MTKNATISPQPHSLAHRYLWIIGGFCLLDILLGCRPIASPPAVVSLKPLPTATAERPPAIPTPPAPTATPDLCPARRAVEMPTRPAEFAAWSETLRGYLADGGDPAQLPAVLTAWQVVPRAGAMLAQADVTGDGVVDTIVSLISPTLELSSTQAALFLYTCQAGTVQTRYSYLPGEWFSLNLIGAQDLTADGVADLVFSEVTCGAHTCWDTLHVWSWSGADFVEQMGTEFMSPYTTFYLEKGQIAASSYGIASAGAGPQRPLTTTLAWNGQAVTITTTAIGPPVYRYHAFCDGDEALFAGDNARAEQTYQQVLTDDALLSWDAFLSREEERLWFNALAHWRLMVQAVRFGDADAAQTHYTRLTTDFNAGQAGSPITALAQRFWASFQESQDVTYACRAALDVPESQTVLDFLNSFGYANPVYERDEVCPFLTP